MAHALRHYVNMLSFCLSVRFLSTWLKGNSVAAHANLKPLRRIRLRNHESTFWRHQELGNEYLSTLEAMFYAAQVGTLPQLDEGHCEAPIVSRKLAEPFLGTKCCTGSQQEFYDRRSHDFQVPPPPTAVDTSGAHAKFDPTSSITADAVVSRW